jgi:hypothetical protein
MFISKCDICHKTIKENTGLRVSLSFYENFELCPNCARPITGFLKSRKLIRKEKPREFKITAKRPIK